MIEDFQFDSDSRTFALDLSKGICQKGHIYARKAWIYGSWFTRMDHVLRWFDLSIIQVKLKLNQGGLARACMSGFYEQCTQALVKKMCWFDEFSKCEGLARAMAVGDTVLLNMKAEIHGHA